MRFSTNQLLKGFSRHCSFEREETKYYGLVEGNVGQMVGHAYFYSLFKKENNLKQCYGNLEYLLEKHHNNFSLGYGLAGFAWGVSLIQKLGFLEDDSADWFQNTESILRATFYKWLKDVNLDYFTGASGILNYFLNRQDVADHQTHVLASNFVKKICELSIDYFFSPKKETTLEKNDVSILNLGVPHGVSGIILLLLQIRKQTDVEVDYLITTFVDRFLNYNNEQEDLPFSFPSLVGDVTRGSKLAWCYGDLPVLYILLEASTLNVKHHSHVEEFFGHINLRRDCYQEDLTVCHGLPSIAYIYFRLWKLTSDEKYRECAYYWKDRMDDLYGKQVDSREDKILKRTSLFNGYPGYFIVSLIIEESIPDALSGILLL